MIIEMKIPSAGESITEVAIGNWLAEDGAWVEKDQEVAEVETDKATLPLIAPESGLLRILISAGDKVNVGDVACTLETEPAVKPDQKPTPKKTSAPKVVVASSPVAEKRTVKVTPLARQIMEHHHLDLEAILQGLKKLGRQEVEMVINHPSGISSPTIPPSFMNRDFSRSPLSPLRRKLSKRLVAVKNETAMLTTFNEVDMRTLLDLRKKHQERFQAKHGVKLGLVSFFARACTMALQQFPKVNSMIEGDELITPGFVDIAIAVQTDKGLMVPVIRDTQQLGIAGLEFRITELANKARNAKLSIDEMTGGTFTITNGGIFGSMLSTPILNPPQAAILGMHNMVERPVVVDGQIAIRPIMYLALSYDHRLIDGRDSVGFLVKVKELIESPLNMVLDDDDPEKILLDL